MSLAQLAIKRPTFIVSILAVLLTLGVMSLSKMSIRMFPDVEFPYVIVITVYQGAGVQEIEQHVTKPLEDAISGISGLKHSMSMNQDNMSIVMGEFDLDKDPDVATQEVRDKVNEILFNLPDDIETPVIMKANMDSMPLVTMSLKAEMNPKELYDFADETLSKELSQVSGVSQVEIIGGSKREIHVNADKAKLKEYELTLSQVAARIEANSLNIPAGKVDRGAMEMTFRTMGEFETIKHINDVVVQFMGNDVPITVKDVAVVADSTEKEVSRGRLNSREENGEILTEPSILLNIYRQAKGNDVAISDGILKKIRDINKKYENSYGKPKLTLISDYSEGVRKNIDNVRKTIIEGVVLAVIVVYFFLGSWRSTFITSLALPNSLIGAFVFMYAAGFSLNVFSLMSMSLAVGLLIDDAIVVRENIFRHYEEGADPVTAAIDGTHEVMLAVIATTSAVIAVFAPVAFLSGIMGQFFKEFGLTVVFAMLISVLDAFTIAPMLSAYIIPEHKEKKPKKTGIKLILSNIAGFLIMIGRGLTVTWFNKVFEFVEFCYNKLIKFIVKKKLIYFKYNLFGKPMDFSLSWRFITVVIAILIFALTIKFAGSKLEMTFMPESEWGEFNVQVEAKPGTSLDHMDKYAKEIEKIIMAEKEIEMVSSSIGSANVFTNSASLASFFVKMIPAEQRKRSTSEMKDFLRGALGEKFGEELEISVMAQGMGGSESDFVIELIGDELSILYEASKVLQKRFKDIPYLVDIKSNYKTGKPELQIKMDVKRMEQLGVNSVVAGNEVRAMIDGTKAGKYREKGLEYDIRVQLADEQKDIMDSFNSVYVNNVNGKLVKLSNVAKPIHTEGPTMIYRKDRAQYVTVEGNLSKGGRIGTIQKEAQKIFNEEKANPKNSEKWKNIQIRASADVEAMEEMQENIATAAFLSILFIFLVLASLYESIITPFTIMSALPLAVIGGIYALIIFGQPIDMFTMIGMIMLLGIVAKNSILLVDYTQQLMRTGMSADNALIKAGTIRLRPILMTSFALIAGMLPTALGLSEVGQFRKGMGIVVIGGIISSTILTLLVVPAIFEYMDKIRRNLRKIVGRPKKRMVDLSDKELEAKKIQ